MTPDTRKFSRVNIPIITEFRPVKEADDFYWGLTKNFSCEGFAFEALDFPHETEKTMEFKLKFPMKGTFILVLGDLMWKKQTGDRSIAGIKLKDMGEELRKEFLERIADYGGVPVERFFSKEDTDMSGREKRVRELPVETPPEQKTLEAPSTKVGEPGVAKHYLDDGSFCLVTFILPADAAPEAERVTIAGEFNNWDTENTVMKKMTNGDFTMTLRLKAGKEYRYRFLIDDKRWENDWHADRYEPNTFGWHDSVVIV